MILDLLQRLDSNSAHKCDEVLGAFHTVIKKLVECGSDVVDLADLVVFTGKLLLRHKSREDFSRPDLIDTAAHSLLQTLSYALQQCEDMGAIDQAAPRLWRSLFWTHFFPPTNEPGDSEPPVVPPLLLSMRCRHMLTEVLLLLTRYDRKEQHRLLLDLRQVLPFPDVGVDHEDAYVYDIPSPFDRTKALRSPCGYVGLRNLSNTCYFNSLFTQLYMNINFREFILNTDLHDGDNSQKLLFQTKLLFAHMQNSVRRFVDTSGCVSAITYEGAPIDIHNQMDVDEFCNVLFDHWETQLPSKQAAKQLRSFYSGELVSQIKSKECEHVSEKSEDFSAIQCDIKGKNNLLESLQAYVDGEIMDGDNKYKCSTCDKKVVAVKRTCLRNLPDNLIFHLKRFDFNLRTMQRSKINDHFSFPAQIDMQPYTADFLMDPSRKSTPDVFELVGVLVHSGTAESGHYYSYIRERPSTDGAETWVEFNDDVVTSWDPAQLESACFGGTDYRPPYDNSNGTVYDKTYSAYMLFYERSSSLRANQELLRRSGQPAPFKWDLEPEMARNIRLENRTLLRRHVLFDPTTIPFVCRNLVRLRERNDGECSRKHDNENLAVSVAINFLDQVATRAKDMPDFDMLLGHLKSLCKSCDRCCAALVRYLTERTEAFRFMVQRNAEPSVRSEVGSLLIFALDRVRRADPVAYGIRPLADEDNDDSDQGEPSDTMHMTERMLARLWNHFHGSIRSWQEAFGVMLEFAKLGLPETALLLSQDYLKRLLWLISADAALDLSPQFARMVTNINRRIATRPPSYESIIGLTHHLISALQPSIDENDVIFTSDVRLQMALEGRRSLPWSAEEVGLLTRTWARTGSNIFLEKLISIGQNTRATDAIIVRLVQLGDEMDNQIAVTLSQNISNLMGPHLNAPFLRAAALYCRFSNNVDRVSSMIQHVIINCRNLQHGEGMEFLDFLKTVFEMERRGTGETAHDIHLQGLANLPRWAPHLLGYFDRDVRLETSHFLDRVLLRHGPTPHFDEIHGGKERSNAMVRTAKQLGVACLVYLRDTYVMRRTNAVRDVVAPLLHVIDRCEKYFTGDDETDSDLEVEFAELSQCKSCAI